LDGITAHAGEPERVNPVAIASVYNLILLFRLTFRKNYCLISLFTKWVKNTVFLELEVHFTVRSDSNSQMRR
jgi:hypothetical protein